MRTSPLYDHASPRRVANSAVAAQTDVNSSRVDMAGFDGVLFLVLVGTVDATGTVTATAGQSPTDALGTRLPSSAVSLGAADDNKILVLDVRRPDERFVDCQVDRDVANSVIDGILAIPYAVREAPADQHSSVAARSSTLAPSE